jgi:hypothetical protein
MGGQQGIKGFWSGQSRIFCFLVRFTCFILVSLHSLYTAIGYAAEAPKHHMITFQSTISCFSTSVGDERPFATKHPRESSESTTIDMEDDLRCVYASVNYLTCYLKQREAESYLILTDRWITGHATDNAKEHYLRRHNRHRVVRSHHSIECYIGIRRFPAETTPTYVLSTS